MKSYTRTITKEVYDRAQENRGYITGADMQSVFTDAERCGYGVYGARADKTDDGYVVRFSMGDSCD